MTKPFHLPLFLRFAVVPAILLLALLSTGGAFGQGSYSKRKVLGEIQSTSPDFQQVVSAICDPGTEMVPDAELERSEIYFRLTERRFVLDAQGKVKEDAFLGGTPYVFLTVPQAGFGRSLYGIYSDLGYDAEGILKQRGVEMVALVIRYQPEIRYLGEKKGGGPLAGADFKKYVYTPTWANAFALFARLAGETAPASPSGKSAYNPLVMQFDNEAQRELARFFPAERRSHLTLLPYNLLRAAGGPDWEYRQLLESKMSMNSHFRGVGLTENTLSPADNRQGLPEFVGPNRQFKELQDYAVIGIGRMEFTEVHE